MKKIILLALLATFLVSCSSDSDKETTDTILNSDATSAETIDRNEEIKNLQPAYKAELYGKIKSIEGNIFTISEIDTSKDPTLGMESAEKRAYMKALSDSDRMALKESINSAVIGDIKVMIPVGIPMIKKEIIGEERLDIEASLADLKGGDLISIWYNKEVTDRKIAVYAKRSIRK